MKSKKLTLKKLVKPKVPAKLETRAKSVKSKKGQHLKSEGLPQQGV